MITKQTIYYCLCFMVFMASCGSYKNIPYYQDLDYTKPTKEKVSNLSTIVIQPADILGVNVSSKNPESSNVFNYNLNRVNGNNYDLSNDNPVTGYLVDADGNIDLPLLGTLKVSGLTTAELRVKMKNLLLTYYKDPVVNIRIINFKIGVYGDVLRPNVYNIPSEQVTITQALTMAGDLNITAKRKNIVLVRTENGERTYIPIDITSKKIFESPYFYLKNNDEIYVQPDKTKFATVDNGYRITTILLTGLSIIAVVLSNIYR